MLYYRIIGIVFIYNRWIGDNVDYPLNEMPEILLCLYLSVIWV